MANPNIVAVATIKGVTKTLASTASLVDITDYPPDGTTFKINSLIACNTHDTVVKLVDVAIYTNHGDTPTTHYIAQTISIPADASLIVLDRNSSIYLGHNGDLTGQKIQVLASDTTVNFTISYEEISDA